MNFIAVEAGSIKRVEPVLQGVPVHHRKHVGIASYAKPACLIGFRLAQSLILNRESKHRTCAAARSLRQFHARQQDFSGGNYEVDALGAARHIRKHALAVNRLARNVRK